MRQLLKDLEEDLLKFFNEKYEKFLKYFRKENKKTDKVNINMGVNASGIEADSNNNSSKGPNGTVMIPSANQPAQVSEIAGVNLPAGNKFKDGTHNAKAPSGTVKSGHIVKRKTKRRAVKV